MRGDHNAGWRLTVQWSFHCSGEKKSYDCCELEYGCCEGALRERVEQTSGRSTRVELAPAVSVCTCASLALLIASHLAHDLHQPCQLAVL